MHQLDAANRVASEARAITSQRQCGPAVERAVQRRSSQQCAACSQQKNRKSEGYQLPVYL